jgi:hypothetical protein
LCIDKIVPFGIIFSIYNESNNFFISDHFDIGINEIKMKHLLDFMKVLTNELTNKVKFRVTKKCILQRIKNLTIKHSEQLISHIK